MKKKNYLKPTILTVTMETTTLMAGSISSSGNTVTIGDSPEPGNAYDDAASKGHHSIWKWGDNE